jgi:pyruvate/2-oxoglutarate dehydrogenase complex dihydrolipoamide dehydrogenase (E3) component
MPGVGDIDYLTNSNMMEVDFLPDHLVVIGGSYIGLEFAQMYRRFGSKVSVIERGPRLLAREDEDISSGIRAILEKEGITIHCGFLADSVAETADGITVELSAPSGPQTVSGSHLLMAVGRRPNTDDLGAEAAGLELDERGGFIKVDDQLRTNVPGIWAIGDCNGLAAFTHTSYNDFEIVVANLFDDDPRRVSDRIPCYGLFIDPPLGRVGMTEMQVRDSGRKALVGRRDMANVGRAKERGETDGFIKIHVDAENGQILGAAILGISGDEVVHQLLDIMYAKAPYTVIQRAMHIHPTVSELIPTVLGDLEPMD